MAHDGAVRVLLLGPLVVLDGDRPIDLFGRRNRALVARLALDAGRPLRAALLVEDLWGTDLPQDPVNALQSVVSRTRRCLPTETLVSTPAGYVLRAQVDLAEFRALVAQGEAAQALALWRGEPLADLGGFPFVTELAEELAEVRLAAVEQDLTRRTPDARMVEELAVLVRDHPYREGLWLARLRTLAACGRAAEALVAYEDLRRRLAEDLGTDPSPALRDLHTRILRGQEPAEGPPTGSKGFLPGPWTSFVGRDDAVRNMLAALDEHRLVTLLGPGGAGKSRLAVETARAGADRFSAVRLIELAPVAEGGLLPAVRAALGSAGPRWDPPGGLSPHDLETRLFDTLAGLEGLLILDNCEHLIDPVAALAERILSVNPRVRILATSREALRITGECTYPLGPLEVPDDTVPVQRAYQAGAVRLFAERARAADRGFLLDGDSLPAVREICRSLDGQPLAIELAAARLRTLTLEEIAARLSDRFALLTQGSRTAPPRHRTLRAVVGWSWDLLEEHERDLAERIAVFPDGVTPAGAAAVLPASADSSDPGQTGAGWASVGQTGVEQAGVEQVLASLADKSLLVSVRGTRRFRMLETLRQYGLERLAVRGIDAEVRRAYRRHYLAVAEELAGWIRIGRQFDAVAVVEAERGNLVAALTQAIEDGDRSASARLVTALVWFWSIRDEHAEFDVWVVAVLRMPGPISPAQEILCSATALAGTYLLSRAGSDRDLLADRILRVWDRHRPDDPFTVLIMTTLKYFGLTGDRVLPEPPDLWCRSMIDLMRLVMAESTGTLGANLRGSLSRTEEGFRRCEDSWGLAMCLSLRGTCESYEGRFDRSLATWQEARALLAGLGAQADLVVSRIRIEMIRIAAADEEQLGRLREEFTEALRDAERRGDGREAALAHLASGHLEHRVGDDQTARSHLLAYLSYAEERATFSEEHVQSMVFATLSIVEMLCGRTEEARTRLAVAVRNVGVVRDLLLSAIVGTATAFLTHLSGDDRRAAYVLGAAVALRGQEDLTDHDARRLSRELRRALGDDLFARIHARGRSLPPQEAMTVVLAPPPRA
ncbi:MAG: hypothetical protein QG608_2891 [Actinomycetota bacterium]|nr:hypothetical protein [Actinomycetota bacterium]